MSFAREFKEFALKGNIVDLAVAVIIGGAFGKIVNSFANDIIMPMVNPFIPGGNWRELVVGPGIMIGQFLAAVLDFLIIAFIIFLMLRVITNLRKKEQSTPAAPPAPSNQEKLLMEIRDALKGKV